MFGHSSRQLKDCTTNGGCEAAAQSRQHGDSIPTESSTSHVLAVRPVRAVSIFERLAAKVKALLKLDSVRFYAPPPDKDDPTASPTGITAWLFPEWFVAQFEVREGSIRSRPLVYRTDLDKGMTYRRDRERPMAEFRLLAVDRDREALRETFRWKAVAALLNALAERRAEVCSGGTKR